MLCNPTATEVNCGFGRAAIRELTPLRRGCNSRCIDSLKRQQEFRQLFEFPTYNLPIQFFDEKAPKVSTFEKRCDQVITAFSKKWKEPTDRATYLSVFSVQQWKSLTDDQKAKHTLSTCQECYRTYFSTQQLFPVKPVFVPEQCTVKLPENPGASEKTNAQHILKDANRVWEETYGHSFTEIVPKLCPEANLQVKRSKVETKKENRQRDRRIAKHIRLQMEQKATLVMLASGESQAQYHNKRMSVSFETKQLGPSPAKKQKSHSPSDENCSWDTGTVLNELREWPEGVRINWSEFARRHNVPGRNAGQVVKEFAKRHSIDTFTLDQRPDTPRTRPRRYKLPGREISSPSLPPLSAVQKERDEMVADGRLKVGEPCTPYTMARFKTSKEGKLYEQSITISGRKFPLLEIRTEMLEQHQQYMHLYSDDDIQAMTANEIKHFFLCRSIQIDEQVTLSDLQTFLARSQRTRGLVMWHDHATILGTGYILVTVNTIYDQAVHLTEEEYFRRTGQKVKSIQKLVEDPRIHMIGVGSSSVEDQASVIPDRVECLHDLHQVVTTSKGLEVNDKLHFFKGDAPAQQFERGTQQGGHYKCGGCGCHANMMEDLAHTLECKWRSLADLQALVLAGQHGNQPGSLKPFEALNVQQLQEELRARNVYHLATTKLDLNNTLRGILRGAQRVPSLLLANPTLSLEAVNLQFYTILDSEPLHDLKGHLINLFTELPFILSGNVKETCQRIIQCNLNKEKVKCADLRLTAVHLYHHFLQHYRSDDYHLLLMQTVVQISEILYLPSSKRSPKRILQLYNCTWLHHTLCSLMFPKLKCLTREKMFGTYLHHLSSHAPIQYEIIALSSANTEAEERLFGQAKQIATQASNRHHENALFNILTRLQAKHLLGEVTTVVEKQEGRVSQAASHLSSFPGSRFSKSFIQQRLSSWQSHLKRISPYLLTGKGVWWQTDGEYYMFSDGSEDPEYRTEGPTLLHFRSTLLQEVPARAEACWETIISKKVELPTPQVRLYDSSGMPIGLICFESIPSTASISSDSIPATTPLVPPATPSSVPATTPLVPPATPSSVPATTPLVPPATLSSVPATTPLVPPATPSSVPATTPLVSPATPSSVPATTPLVSPATPSSVPATIPLGPPATPFSPLHVPGTISQGPPNMPLKTTSATVPIAPPVTPEGTSEDCTPNLTSLLECYPTPFPSSETGSTPRNHPNRHVPVRHLFENISAENDNDERELQEATLQGLLNSAEDKVVTPLKTKLATAISKAIGTDATVRRLDEIRVTLKSAQKQRVRLTKQQIENHDQLMASIQSKVLRRKSELKESIKTYELKFQQQYSRLPSQHDDEHYAKLYKDLRYTKWLLTTWDVQL